MRPFALQHLVRTLLLLLAALTIGLLVLVRPVAAQETRTVAGTFDFGIVGRQGRNPGTMNDLRNFSTLGLRISFFAFDEAGFGGTQGNDLRGFLRMISHDGQIIEVSGSINWQIKKNGRTVYIGIVPDTLTVPLVVSTPGGPYVMDGMSNFAVRLPGETLAYADRSNVKGAANPPDTPDIPTFEAITVPGVPELAATASHSILEGTTLIADLDTEEWVSWVITGGADAALFDIDPISGVLIFREAPDYEAPRDADGDNRYEVDILAMDLDGQTSQQATTVDVTPLPPQISSSKSVQPASVLGRAFDCAADPADPEAAEMLPGTCVTYRIEISNDPQAGHADALRVVDDMPTSVMAIGILASGGFDNVEMSANSFTGEITRFDPGETAWVEIRAILQ